MQKQSLYFYMAFALSVAAINAQASTLNHFDNANLISAIDDYYFSDYETSIPKLEDLYKKSPNNPDILQYLALSYKETKQPKKAIPIFEAWLKAKQRQTTQDTRFAWLGLANAYRKAGKNKKAVETLYTWTSANPDDLQSQISLGDALVRMKEYESANIIWNNILNNNNAKKEDQAAALYYKAWSAYLNQDIEQAKSFATQSLEVDNEGTYAGAAKQLEQVSRRRLGPQAYLSLEPFYNSNVKLISDTSNVWGGDKGLQTTVILGWLLPAINLSYIFSSTSHEDFNAYDVSAHIISASWKKDKKWRFKPFYEYVSLDTDNLYQSLGLSAYYTQEKWTYQYTGKFKAFNASYGTNASDLSRLGGSSHYFAAKSKISNEFIQIDISPFILAELTKGDATHNKSDNFFEYGLHLSTDIPIKQGWKTKIKFNFYNKSYATADRNILLSSTDTTKREDVFLKLSNATSWKPWNEYNIYLTFNISYLINSSNYNESLVSSASNKSYSALRVGTMLNGRW